MAKNGILPARVEMFGPGGQAQLDGLDVPMNITQPSSPAAARQLHLWQLPHPGWNTSRDDGSTAIPPSLVAPGLSALLSSGARAHHKEGGIQDPAGRRRAKGVC
jgi:hypothetical protein